MEELRVWDEDPEEGATSVVEKLDGQPYMRVELPQAADDEYQDEFESSLNESLPRPYFVEYCEDGYASIARQQTRIGRVYDNVVKG